MRRIYAFMLLFLLVVLAYSQQVTFTGTIVDENGKAYYSANVLIIGKYQGAISDFDGKFSVENVNNQDSVRITSVGYVEIKGIVSDFNGKTLKLTVNAEVLPDVVITALGVKREKKSLGYSVVEVDGEELQTSRDVSAINSLSGKVAGLEVNGTNGSAGSSNRIVLRGSSSFEGDNQALIVVDGVPLNNTTISNSEDEWGGMDFGNGASDLNPDDIESISVLKGASAAALYGSKAANGVILITTKKGKSRKGIGIQYNGGISVETPYILYDFQDVYGAGRNGNFEGVWTMADGIPTYNSGSAAAYGSWGPKMLGQEIVDWNGEKTTFSPQENNYRDFFKNGITANNSVSLSGGNETATYRFSLSNLKNNDIIPNTSLNRTSLALRTSVDISKSLNFDASVNYINQKADNRYGLSDSHDCIPRNYIQMPRHISSSSLENSMFDEFGNETTWYSNWAWMTNPYWNNIYELNDDHKDRFYGKIALNYEINDAFNLMIRSGMDLYNQEFTNITAYKGLINSLGAYSERWHKFNQLNNDFIFSYKDDFLNNKIHVNWNIGGSTFYQEIENFWANTEGGISIPYFYNIDYSNEKPSVSNAKYEKATRSVYSFGQIAYDSYLFLDITARNDWSSTLPKENNSFMYPSVSTSFVFSDAFKLFEKIEKAFPYGKIRASWAQVGSDTDPYRLSQSYSQTGSYLGLPYAQVNQSIPLADLKPEITSSWELGSDLRFFNNRIGLDFTYYNAKTRNQILVANVSYASGYSGAIINSGEVQNSGFEMQLRMRPIEDLVRDIRMDITLNYVKNKSMVNELTDGLDNYLLLEHWGLSIEARPGNPYGDIVGYAIQRDDNGAKLVDENGMYIRTATTQVLGNINPDFRASIGLNLSLKKFSCRLLVDGKFGGEMFAGTNMYGYGYAGNFAETLEGRAEWYASEEARIATGVSAEDWVATGGYLAEGVYLDGSQNTTYLNPENYWGQFSDWTNEIHEQFVYDASFIKLREIVFSYKLPDSFANKIFMQKASVSIYARNLWLIWSKVPNIDPESTHTNGNGQGYELYSYPTRKSFGINLSLTF